MILVIVIIIITKLTVRSQYGSVLLLYDYYWTLILFINPFGSTLCALELCFVDMHWPSYILQLLYKVNIHKVLFRYE